MAESPFSTRHSPLGQHHADCFKRRTCPSCGAVSVYLNPDHKTAYCWQGHGYANEEIQHFALLVRSFLRLGVVLM